MNICYVHALKLYAANIFINNYSSKIIKFQIMIHQKLTIHYNSQISFKVTFFESPLPPKSFSLIPKLILPRSFHISLLIETTYVFLSTLLFLQSHPLPNTNPKSLLLPKILSFENSKFSRRLIMPKPWKQWRSKRVEFSFEGKRVHTERERERDDRHARDDRWRDCLAVGRSEEDGSRRRKTDGR